MTEIDEVAALLRGTAQAHHEAFAATDGADPEWPLWYAEYLAPRLGELFGSEITRSQLVHSLLSAEETAGGSDWAESYASVLLERHATE